MYGKAKKNPLIQICLSPIKLLTLNHVQETKYYFMRFTYYVSSKLELTINTGVRIPK